MPFSKSGRSLSGLLMVVLALSILTACGDNTATPVPPAQATTASSNSVPLTTGSVTTAPAATTGTPPATTAAAATTAVNAATTAASNSSTPKQEITLALGYIPNVQFAHMYVALEKGYFAEEGLNVKIQYGTINDLMAVVGQGKIQFAQASGDEVLQARAQGIPITYIAAIYQKYPVALAALKDRNINKPADLKGKTVAIPGPFGSNYTGLKVLLAAGNLTQDDVKVQSVGFTQREVLQQGKADAAVVFSMNEPVQLRKAGVEINTIEVSSLVSLASIGLITSDSLITSNPELVRKMVRAVTRGLKDTIANPDDAFERTIKVAPDARGADPELQKQVLKATTGFMVADNVKGQPLGYVDPKVWEASEKFLLEQKLLASKIDPSSAYTNKFVNADVGKY
ncbi:MAG: hypothetical protein JWP00_2162 [Chloroflexi bacterium]|jgi:NitT/TauT family transport system substrate-binding protein|nr:hypothetical protein [Chloroflexota bacterium]